MTMMDAVVRFRRVMILALLALARTVLRAFLKAAISGLVKSETQQPTYNRRRHMELANRLIGQPFGSIRHSLSSQYSLKGPALNLIYNLLSQSLFGECGFCFSQVLWLKVGKSCSLFFVALLMLSFLSLITYGTFGRTPLAPPLDRLNLLREVKLCLLRSVSCLLLSQKLN